MIFRVKYRMVFPPWSKPSAYEAVNTVFNEFTDGENCAIPYMRSRVLRKSASLRTFKYPLEGAKREMQIFFFRPGEKRVDVSDPEIQSGIYQFFSDILNWDR